VEIPVSSSNPEINWERPFTPDNGNMPQTYGSGASVPLEIRLDLDYQQSADGISWYRKKIGQQTWTQVESQNVKEQWKHGLDSNEGEFTPTTYFFDKNTADDISVDQGASITKTVDGQEVQFSVQNVDADSTPRTASVEVGGIDYNGIYAGEYTIPPNVGTEDGPYFRIEEIQNFAGGDPYVRFVEYTPYTSPNDGNYRYKAVSETDSGDRYHTESIYFYVTDVVNQNAPYIEEITAQGDNTYRLYDFFSSDSINPGTTLNVTVVQQEDDPYNITLVDRSTGQEIQEIKASDAGIDTLYSDAVGGTLEILGFDASFVQGQNKIVIPFKLTKEGNQQYDFLNTQDSNYQLGFKIEDLQSVKTRESLTYEVNTSGSNPAPTIDSIQASPDCSSYTQFSSYSQYSTISCVKVDYSDANSDTEYAAINITQLYDNQVRESYSSVNYQYSKKSGSSFIFNLSEIDTPTDSLNESGKWQIEAEVSDGLNTDTSTSTLQVPWGDLSVVRERPSSVPFSLYDNETFMNSYSLRCGGGPECVNQNRSVTLAWDPRILDPFFGEVLT